MSDTDRTQSPYMKALACSAVTFVIAVAALFFGYKLPSLGAIGVDATSKLLALTLVPGLVVGLLAKKSTRPWPLWLIVGTFVVVLVVVTVVHELTAPMRA